MGAEFDCQLFLGAGDSRRKIDDCVQEAEGDDIRPWREGIPLTVIRGNWVVLRDAHQGDVDEYVRWWDHGQEWQKWDAPWEILPQVNDVVARLKNRLRQEPPVPRVSMEVDTVDGDHVGWVNRYWLDENAGWLEVGINLPEAGHWGRGLGTEALALWVDYLFTEADVHRIGLGTWSGNERMLRVAEKLGFRTEARFREARLVQGRRFDAVRCGLLRGEWESLRGSWPGITSDGRG